MSAKYIFVTGGVVSSIGKGITVASIGRILKNRNEIDFRKIRNPEFKSGMFFPAIQEAYRRKKTFGILRRNG